MKEKIIPSDLIEQAWNVFTKNWVGFVLLTLGYGVISSLLSSLTGSNNSSRLTFEQGSQLDWSQLSRAAAEGATSTGLSTIIGILIAPFVTLWVYQFINDRIQDKTEFWNFLRVDWKKYFNLLIYTLLISIATLAILGVLVLLSTVLVTAIFSASPALAILVGLVASVLIIIVMVYISLRLSMSEYNIADMGVGPIQAVRNSLKMTKGKTFSLFGFALLFFGIGTLGFLALLLGLLVALPVIYIAEVMIYRALKARLEVDTVSAIEVV